MEYVVYQCAYCKGEYIILTAELKRLGVSGESVVCPYCKENRKHKVGEYDDFKECMKNK